jgi:seryl-tRNA synthetase
MLDIKFIRENRELIEQNNKNRKLEVDLGRLLKLDEERRATIKEIDDLRALRNQTSKGKPSEEEISRMREVGTTISNLEKNLAELETEFQQLAGKIPNLTHPDSPIGGEESYKVLYTNKEPEKFSFQPKDHEQLLIDLDLVDFERGTKVTTSKF